MDRFSDIVRLVLRWIFEFAENRKKIIVGSVSLLLAFVLSLTFIPYNNVRKADNAQQKNSESNFVGAADKDDSGEVLNLATKTTTKKTTTKKTTTKKTTTKKTTTKKTTKPKTKTIKISSSKNTIKVVVGGKKNKSIEDNDFLDALTYTGYNLKKHRKDGMMWKYVLCADKPRRKWLSKITYGGGCSGYEKTSSGKPNIARFQKGGLVCASYATYVYFNYLPNVVGIKTSYLPKPAKSYDANSWYIAGQKWVKKGYSRYIKFTAKSKGTRTVFKPKESIPIGSLMLLTDFKKRNNHCTHICLYAGYKNGYHWVTHVGNSNGPEFCAMERMSCGPDPQWPLKIITTPKGIVKK
ncbi:MAG: hypothetical protein MJ090_00400 [Clostridia bacterium]|nr:hypothetical protein [Clostridia bacterium]